MTNVLVNPVPGDANVVVGSRLAASQWEIFLAQHALAAAEPVWLTPNVASFRDWAETLHARSVPAPSDALLTRSQSLALWRRVIDDSDAGRALIGSRAAAHWAAEARGLLCGWNVDTAALPPAPGDEDFRAFLSWHGAYRSHLRDGGWLDDAELDRRIAGGSPAPAGPIVLCDGFEPTLVQRSLFDRWRDAGHAVLTAPLDRSPAATCRIELPDEAAEIGCAARWAAARATAEPHARIALVVPELERRQAAVRRRLDDAFAGARATPAVYFQSAGRLVDLNAVDAALDALEMLLPERSFEPFCRWLRKLVVCSGDPKLCSEAALLEARLRGDLRSQLGFVDAYHGTGLAGLIQREAPGVAAIVDPAVAAAADWHRHRTPTLWGIAWQQSLRQLGWTSPAAPDPAIAQSWERALTELEQLTPVTGPVSAARAFEELKATLGRRAPAASLPLSGIHVLDDVDSIGPGYAAAWVTGLGADRWPQGAELNPLLPRRVQTAHRMPGSSPELALERSLERLRRAASRVDTLVLSSPQTRHESRAEPSALVQRFVTAAPEGLGVERVGPAAAGAGRAVQWIDDPAPPLTGTALRGGARTLDLQAACPLRAFCESRLGARPLERAEQGLSRRLRGIATHRALERLLAAHPSRDALQRLVDTGAGQALRDAAEHGLKPYFGPVRRTLGRLLDLERERLIERLDRLLRAELARLPFELDAAERRQVLVIGGLELRLRIDRVDRLADGSLAVLDYKTGSRTGMPDWFGSRLRDTQLPVYALERGNRVAALAVVALEDARNPYKGTWRLQGAFPGRPARLPDERTFEQQMRIWREQIDTLVAELSGGDTRIFTDRLDAVTGDYAPLTRVYEQLAELRREAAA